MATTWFFGRCQDHSPSNRSPSDRSLAAATAQSVVNVYIFGSYLPQDLLAQFTQETGIQVNVTECSNNEELFIKLRMNAPLDYDLIAPSSYYVGMMAELGLLQPIDFAQIPNSRLLLAFLQNPRINRDLAYSVPYCWGTTGIVVNRQFIAQQRPVTSWRDLWHPTFKRSIMLLDDMRENFSMALLSLGYSVNDEDPVHIKEAYQVLCRLMPNVLTFNSDGVSALYLDEDVQMGMVWSGDIVIPQQLNPQLDYIYPEEGSVLWFDSFAVLKRARHKENAYKLINFMLRPEISLEVSRRLGFASANREAYARFRLEQAGSNAAHPTPQQLERCQIQYQLSDQARKLYEYYWSLLRFNGTAQ